MLFTQHLAEHICGRFFVKGFQHFGSKASFLQPLFQPTVLASTACNSGSHTFWDLSRCCWEHALQHSLNTLRLRAVHAWHLHHVQAISPPCKTRDGHSKRVSTDISALYTPHCQQGIDGRQPGIDGRQPGIDGRQPGMSCPVCISINALRLPLQFWGPQNPDCEVEEPEPFVQTGGPPTASVCKLLPLPLSRP